MIREFWVQNYLSIKDRQELSFESKSKDTLLSVEVAHNVYLNKIGILYGANASGKTNMLYAIENIFDILYQSRNGVSRKVISAPPFAQNVSEPTLLHVTFYAYGIRYDYDVEYMSTHILSEVMYYYPNGSRALFYQRKFMSLDTQADVKFGDSLRLTAKTKNAFVLNTLNNHSVLSSCGKLALAEEAAPLMRLYRWIEAYVHQIDGDRSEKSLVEELQEVLQDEKKYRFYKLMLQKADLNIHGFKYSVSQREIPHEIKEQIKASVNLPEEVKERMLKEEEEDIIFINKSETGSFELPYRLQSKGTQKYLENLRMLYDMVCNDHIYLLDEMGEDLHYELLLYFLNVFIYNSKYSQLVFTSQESTLLSEDLINEHRDLVWFVEKSRQTASSIYSRGDSFGLHKNMSLYNAYRIGRLGAVPELGSFLLDLND